MISGKPIKVLLVDDSAMVTKVVSHIINEDKELTVMGVAANPYEAVEIMKREKPDVILLDIEMPRMDGLTFLRKIMTQHPIPVVIFSGVAPKNSRNAVKALEYGAVAVLQKPKSILSPEFQETKIRFLEALKGAAASVTGLPLLRRRIHDVSIFAENEITELEKHQKATLLPSRKVIVLGASTGGTQAIEFLMRNIKTDLPGMLITQHMPGEFTRAFAERLNTISKLHIQEAEDGEIVHNNTVYIGNGFYHILLEKEQNTYKVRIKDGPLVNRHKPSVDVLFRSAARQAGPQALGILLTGMGNDGAKGLLEMKEAGAITIAQDKKSSVVFGMPRAAIQLGAAQYILSLNEILKFLNHYTP